MTVPKADRWMVADECMSRFLVQDILPARKRRLDREARLGAYPADLALVHERTYDAETRRLLRDIDALRGQEAGNR